MRVLGVLCFGLWESGRVRGTGGTDMGMQRREGFPTAGRAGPLAPVADVGERAIAAGGDGRECPPVAGTPRRLGTLLDSYGCGAAARFRALVRARAGRAVSRAAGWPCIPTCARSRRPPRPP